MIDSSLFTDKAKSKKPTCEIVEKASNRLSRYCANPTTVPIINDSKEVVSNRFFQMLIEPSKTLARFSDPICSSNRKIKIEILGITVNQVVTIVGTPSYTSGAQLWKGAAATLNKNPTAMINTPKTIDRFSPSAPLMDPTE